MSSSPGFVRSHTAPIVTASLFAVLVILRAPAASQEGLALPAAAVDVAAGQESTAVAVFAGGCFWGVQGVFQHVKGVTNAVSGYAGGARSTATYEQTNSGTTGHAESVQVTYDPRQISYGRLLQVFFSVAHDPTQLNRQGPDIGTQYRSTIFPVNAEQAAVAKAYIAQLDRTRAFKKRIATTIETDRTFYLAEPYHQDFLARNPRHPYIVYNDLPKIEHLKHFFPDLFRATPVLVSQAGTQTPSPAPLADLVVPPGFNISVFASGLAGARLMTVSPEGVLLLARRRTHEVVALPDRNKDGVAEPAVILTGLPAANSLAFRDGYLYIATTPAVMRVRWTNGAPDGAPAVFAELPSSTPSVHTSRVLGFGPDGRLYVSIGSSCDVCIEPDERRTTIQVFDANGAGRPFAMGLRNANGFDWDPATGRMWAGDNGQDGLGPDFPPDEINLVEAGRHYGFPFFIGRNRPNTFPG
jgi:peptide-methionine (S)-S-oxide reductase